jgi:hypothetical protein
LKRFKNFFKGWGSSQYGHTKKRKNNLKMELAYIEELGETLELSSDLHIRKTLIMVEFLEIYKEE